MVMRHIPNISSALPTTIILNGFVINQFKMVVTYLGSSHVNVDVTLWTLRQFSMYVILFAMPLSCWYGPVNVVVNGG